MYYVLCGREESNLRLQSHYFVALNRSATAAEIGVRGWG